MRVRSIPALAAVGALMVGCGGAESATPGASSPSSRTASTPGVPTVPDPQPTTESPFDPGAPDTPTPPSPTAPRPTTETEKLLLRRQIDLQLGGDGLFLSCQPEESATRVFDRDPGVWVNNLYSPTEYPDHMVLCLRGFTATAPIDLELTAGPFRAHTDVRPVEGAPEASDTFVYEEEPSDTLFDDGATLSVYTQDYGGGPIDGPAGALISEMWRFVPPAKARQAMVEAGSFTVTATQGDVRAEIEQPIAEPTIQTSDVLYGNGKEPPRLILLGFPAGADVPIGVYRRSGSSAARAVLIKEIGRVVMPDSRVAEFSLSPYIKTSPPGYFCVSPPVNDETGCNSVVVWPDYPGSISVGDRGSRVKAWQKILIQAEIISDRPENRDGVYGSATQAAVRSYLQDRGIAEPDDLTTLGRDLYDLVTG